MIVENISVVEVEFSYTGDKLRIPSQKKKNFMGKPIVDEFLNSKNRVKTKLNFGCFTVSNLLDKFDECFSNFIKSIFIEINLIQYDNNIYLIIDLKNEEFGPALATFMFDTDDWMFDNDTFQEDPVKKEFTENLNISCESISFKTDAKFDYSIAAKS